MELNQYIDHTILKPDTTNEEIEKICFEAKEYKFKSVCINGSYARKVTELLQGSNVKTCVVVGFPLGAMDGEVKAYEAEKAISDGASEIDMVINIGELKNGNYQYVLEDIQKVTKAAEDSAIVKVIIETCLLTKEEKIKACELAIKAGAEFVKTSTGFSTGGATIEDVELMKKTVGNKIEIKASGGVRTKEEALKMIEAGATRIGTSNGVKIVKG